MRIEEKHTGGVFPFQRMGLIDVESGSFSRQCLSQQTLLRDERRRLGPQLRSYTGQHAHSALHGGVREGCG